jgi:hypothetical protein
MPDRSDEFRKAAADCVALARTTNDPTTRTSLLIMAQNGRPLVRRALYRRT